MAEEIFFDERDLLGSRLFIRDSQVFLRLAGEQKELRLGKLYYSRKGALVLEKTIEERHVLQAAQAVGFCDDMLRHLPKETVLVVRYQGRVLWLTIEDARKVGFYLYFKKQGFERQFFVKLADFKERKTIETMTDAELERRLIEKFEREHSKQVLS